MESRVRNVRMDEETVTRLTRAEKIGGVELPHDEAEKLVEALVAKIASVKIAPDNEPEPVAVVSAPTVIPIEAKVSNRGETSPSFATEVSPQATSKSGHGVMPEDEHEANLIRENVLPKVVSPALYDMNEEIKTSVGAVLDATTVPLSVPLEERLQNACHLAPQGRARYGRNSRDVGARKLQRGAWVFFPPTPTRR